MQAKFLSKSNKMSKIIKYTYREVFGVCTTVNAPLGYIQVCISEIRILKGSLILVLMKFFELGISNK